MIYRKNSTIGVKEKTCISCGKSCYWFSKKRCQQCARIEDTLKRIEQETEKVIEKEGLWDLIKDADDIFSQYIRLIHANENGWVKCFTCDAVDKWTNVDNGHYMKRGNLYLRHDERNCKPQCKTCNGPMDGNMIQFTSRLEVETPGLPDILREEAVLSHKPTREEIRQVIAEYTPKVKILKSKIF